VVSVVGALEAARAKSKRGKDAGSARSLCATGATEDAASRRFAAGRAGRTRGGDHLPAEVLRELHAVAVGVVHVEEAHLPVQLEDHTDAHAL